MRFFASSIFVVALVVALGAHGSPQGKKLYSPVRGSTQQEAQTLNCYDYPNYGGDSLQAIDYIPDLAQYGFDNLISGCEFNGVWMLYDNYDYNAANFQVSTLTKRINFPFVTGYPRRSFVVRISGGQLLRLGRAVLHRL